MKRQMTALVVSLIMVTVSTAFAFAGESKEAVAAKGQPAKTVAAPPSTEFIIKGVVKPETYVNHRTTIIMTETGKKYVLFNPPFVNTLMHEGMGKEVTIKGKEFQKTNFKNYPGFWVSDIIEMKKK